MSTAKLGAALLVILVLVLGATTLARAETMDCTAITALPAVIIDQGVHCLTSDLSTNAAVGHAIDIQTNNVVVDLNGFTLSGSAGLGTQAIGIHALNRQNITLKNGLISGFLVGIFLEDDTGLSQGHVVENVRAAQNTFVGMHVEGTGILVRDSQVAATGGTTTLGTDADAIGILASGAGPRVVDNDVIDTTKQGAGMAVGIQFAAGTGGCTTGTSAPQCDIGAGLLVDAGTLGGVAVDNRITGADKGIEFLPGATGKCRGNLTFGVPTPFTGCTNPDNGKLTQTINFTSTAPADATVGGPTYDVTATGGASGNPVTFAIDASATSVCAIVGATVSFNSVGTCVINANQAGDATYDPAPQVQQSFAVGQGSQTINFTSTAPANATVGGPTYNVMATGGASGNPVTFTIDASASTVCSIAGSTVSFIGAGTCVIDANQAGDANYNAASQAQQSFTVASNQSPVITEGDATTVTMDEDGAPTAFSLTLNATDADGDTLTWSISSPASNGSATASGTGTSKAIGYTPNADFHGSDSFVVQVADGHGGTDTITVTVTVREVNDAPVATADSKTTAEDTALIFAASDLIANDLKGPANESGQTLTVTGVSTPSSQGGTVGLSSGTITYTPAANFNGADSFTYTVCDNGTTNGAPDPKCTNGTVNVTVTEVNDAPVPVADTATVAEDSGATAIAVLANDSKGATNESGQTLTISAVTQGTNGTVIITGGGTGLTYAPAANFNGPDSFTYTVCDNGTTNGAADPKCVAGTTVSVTVTAVNDAPVPVADSATVAEDSGATAIAVLANDSKGPANESGQTLTISAVTQGTNGTVIITGGGTGLTYAPAANFNGADSFTYTVCDNGTTNGAADPKCVTGTAVTVTVTAVNDAPVAQNKNGGAVQTNMQRTGIDAGLLTGVTDADQGVNGCSVTFSVASIGTTVTHGTVSNVNTVAGTFDFEPEAGYTGPATVSYTVSDNGCPLPAATSAPATISLTVSGPVIWFVDPNLASNGTGTLASPFNSLASATTAKGTNANHRIFVYDSTDPDGGATTAAGVGVTLDAVGGQWLVGQGVTGANFDTVMGLTGGNAVPAGTIARPGINRTRPVIQGTVAISGNDSVVRGLNITPSTAGAQGLTGGSVTGVTTGEVDLTTGTGTAVNLNGTGGTVDIGNVTSTGGTAVSINAGSGTVAVTGTLSRTGTAATGISVTNRTSGTVTFSGGTKTLNTSTSGAVSLATNSSATISFTNGGLDIDTTTGTGFSATGGGTVNVTGSGNTISSGSGTALNVTSTTIGASGLTFGSISKNGGTNGIVLNTTGSSGGLTVTGDGTSTNNGSGGTIQNTSGHGILLNSTRNISLDQLNISSTGGSGIDGVGVTNFSYTNGTITSAGNAGFESAIAFNGSGTIVGNNIAGTLTVTGNTFTNPFYAGLDVQANDGTVTDANVSNNTISNPGFSGVNFVGTGTSSTVFNLNNATINQNNISGSGGNGVQISTSNANASGPGATAGIPGDVNNRIDITNNSISTDSGATQAITVANNGANSGSRTRTHFLIECNGKNTGGCTAPTANPITGSLIGTTVLVGNNGYSTMVGTVNNNIIDSNHTSGDAGGGGNGVQVANGTGGLPAEPYTPDLTATVTSNVITDTNGNGILVINRTTASGILKAKISSNTVAAPNNDGGSARQGIRVDAGTSTSDDDDVCVTISSNTSAGSNAAAGIGIRKEGGSATTNAFGITGLSPSPATGAQAAAFVVTQNPAGGGADNISGTGTNFTSCATAPL